MNHWQHYRFVRRGASPAILLGAILVALSGLSACGGAEKSAAAPGDGDSADDRIELGEHPSDRRSAVPSLDDDDDDGGMQITGTKGHLDPYEIQKGFKPKARELTRCFTGKVKRRRHVGGSIRFKFYVSAEGEIESASIFESNLGAWDVEQCLIKVARQMTFARPRGGPTDFDVPLEFQAHRRVQWWPEDRTDGEVEAKLAELDACAGDGAPSDVWVTLYVGTRGKVLSVGFASKANPGVTDAWANCAAPIIKGWTLSDPRGQVAKAGFRLNAE